MKTLKAVKKQKILIFIFVTVVMALALAAYSYAKQNTYKYILYKETGNVYYKQEGQDKYQKMAGDEVELNGVSYIKTDAKSIAQVLFPNNSLMSVDENSEVKVEYTPTDTSIFQLLGKTYHRVKRLLQDQSYIVITRSAIAAVRGTKFGVMVNNDDTATIVVTESTVDVNSIMQKNGINKIITGGKVTEGNMVTLPNNLVDENNVIFTPVQIPEEVKNSDWFKRNVIFDIEYDVKKVNNVSLADTLEEKTAANTDDSTDPQNQNSTNNTQNANNTNSTQNVNKVEPVKFDAHILLNLNHPQICAVTNTTDFQNFYLQVMHNQARYGIYFQTLNSYLGLLRSYCVDGSLSGGDKSSLQLLLVLLPADIFDKDYSSTLPTPTPIPSPTVEIPVPTPTP